MIERFRRVLADGDVFELGPQEDLSAWFTMPPRLGLKPRDASQCAAALREAAALGAAVVPWGGGQHQDLGNVPRPVEVVLSTSAMSGLVEYDPADQTLVARAGTRLADLIAHVRQDGLFLPLDPSGLARATIGGVVAANVNGPLRAGYGRPRDLVLGAKAAYSDGAVAKSGGRLVKNVTGFDLHRLFCGSLGSLAVICEVALRLRPLPEREASSAISCRDAETLDAVLGRLRTLDEPAACRVVDRDTARAIGLPDPGIDATFVVWLRRHGFEAFVARALERTEQAAREAGADRCERFEGAEETGAWAALREWRGKLDPRGAGVVLRYSLPGYVAEGVGCVAAVGGLADAIFSALAADDGAPPGIVADPTLGEVRVHLARPPRAESLDRLTRVASYVARSRVEIEGGPAAWRAARDAYLGGYRNPKWTRRLKRALDPAGVLCPGRLIFGGER